MDLARDDGSQRVPVRLKEAGTLEWPSLIGQVHGWNRAEAARIGCGHTVVKLLDAAN